MRVAREGDERAERRSQELLEENNGRRRKRENAGDRKVLRLPRIEQDLYVLDISTTSPILT